MKKKLLVSLFLASQLPCFAQDDVSAYFLVNNGFDTNFNYGAELKGNIAGDVIHDVYGWTNETTATYTVAGTFAYNNNITFNGSSPLPSSGYNGSEGGALGLTTGWGMQLVYSQSVTLPKGKYRLCAAYYNVGSASAGNSLLAWIPDNGAQKSSDVKSFPKGVWKTDTLTFTIDARTEGKIQIGLGTNESSGSGSHAKILVDYVKLFCDNVDKSELESAISSAVDTYGDGTGVYAEELKKVIDEAQNVYDNESASPIDIISLTSRLNEVEQIYKYKNASDDNPLNVTSLITNPSFEDGTIGWDNQGFSTQTNSYFPGKSGSTYLECWVSRGSKVPDVNISQNLKGIPDGQYRLRVASGNIQQKGSGSSVNVGERQTGACVYAGFYSMPADTMKYKNLYFTVVGGQITLGLRTENATGNWVCLDNLMLYYLGGNTPENYAEYLSKYIEYIKNNMLTKHIHAKVRENAETAIAEAEKLIASETLDEKAMADAKVELDSVVININASDAVFADFAEAIDYAEKVRGWYEDDVNKFNKMDAAIEVAQVAYDNVDLTAEEIERATQTLENVTKVVDKKVYTAKWSMGDVSNPNNKYYIGRTRQSKNWILFWEKDYGENPKNFVCGSHNIDVDEVLRHAEIAFRFYTDSLKFIKPGRSQTDTYKMVIRLRYEPTGWEATGSGVDSKIGLLTLTPWAAPSRNWQTLYHEVGHCFQYQVHCDNGDQNGWVYSPGNGKGCAFWEQCAQWQAYKIMPDNQFTNEWFSGYLSNVHKHILHEWPRYNNYFVQDFWTYKHGMDFIGKLWNESKNPEDPVEAYMRITGITTSQFNDEMYECAARFATWDIPALESYGASKIDSRPQPAMTKVDDNYWQINASVAPENTGHNIIKLNVPKTATTVSACFEGLNNEPGYHVINPTYAEWRYGFVAQLEDSTRVYGSMGKSTYSNPIDTISFECPDNCKRLYFVVSGGPKTYWRQAWDDNGDNDEQWPYKVKFGNTNRYGSPNLPDVTAVESVSAEDDVPSIYVSDGLLHVGQASSASDVRILTLSGICIKSVSAGSAIDIPLEPGIYIVDVRQTDGNCLLTKKIVVR